MMDRADDFTGGRAEDLMPGRQKILTEAAAANTSVTAWQMIDVPRPCVLMPSEDEGARLVRYYSTSPNEQTILQGLAYVALDGICYMTRPGRWWVNVPTSGSPGTADFVLKDVQSAVLAQAIATASSAPNAVLNRSSFKSDQLAVAAAGTPEQYATSVAIPDGFTLVLIGHPSNTGNVYLGFTSADALGSSGKNIPIPPGSSVPIALTNWNIPWFDVDVNGERVILGSET